MKAMHCFRKYIMNLVHSERNDIEDIYRRFKVRNNTVIIFIRRTLFENGRTFAIYRYIY